jgi:hypothetical protein
MTGSSEAHTGRTLACWYVEPQHRPRMGATRTRIALSLVREDQHQAELESNGPDGPWRTA